MPHCRCGRDVPSLIPAIRTQTDPQDPTEPVVVPAKCERPRVYAVSTPSSAPAHFGLASCADVAPRQTVIEPSPPEPDPVPAMRDMSGIWQKREANENKQHFGI